jgi:hypothetical protein
MHRPALVFVGALIVLAGLVFTLQGVGVLTGSAMSNTTFWTIGGPVVVVIGLALVGSGVRSRPR